MDLVTPGIGLIFWSTLFFLILLFVLGKFAWPAILTAVVARNESIRKALESADQAREEMKQLQANNEKILAEAKAERNALLKDARDVKDRLISEAKEQASLEAKKLLKSAKEAIHAEKASAITEMKEQMAVLSVDIAEKLIKLKLGNDKEQKELVNKLVDEIDLN